MERQPSRRRSRRAFLGLALGAGVAILGGQIGCQPSGSAADPDDDLARHEELPPGTAPDTRPRPVVALVRGDDPAAMVRSAVALAGGLNRVVRRGATVLLKPNLTIPSAGGLGNVTDPRVVREVIELCRQAGAARILIGDGAGGGDTEQIMRKAGYEPVLKATGATFVDLNRDDVVIRRLADPAALAEYSLARVAAEAPVLISLPVLKVHNSALVSLSCKNLMGIAAPGVYGRPRLQLHNAGLSQVIADLVRLRTPDFAIVDGTVGLEGDSPMNGTPVPMNLVIAGRDPVSVDAVGAAVMGIDPQSVGHLTLLAKKAVGEIDLARIALKGRAIADVRRSFKR